MQCAFRAVRMSTLSTGAAAAILFAALSASAAIPAGERQALLDLYGSSNGSSWTDRSGWGGSPGTECSWFGVQCDSAGLHVTALELDGDNLAGTLPASIGSLSGLEYLILPNNRLEGPIPDVSALGRLRIFELYNNRLTGPVPDLAGLSALESLELNSNQLTGTIPDLSDLSSLQVFDLDTNRLTGPVPDLSSMTQLTYIALDTNELSGPIPTLAALHELTDCELYDNELSGPVPSLAGLTKLGTLLLANNRLTGGIPDVTGVPLETLDLSYNDLSGGVPASLGGATTLRHLYLAGNALVGSLPIGLVNLSNLEPGGSDLRYNGLFSPSADLSAFLDGKQEQSDWESTQTVAPSNLTALAATDDAVRLGWDPIAYSADAGAYQVLAATSPAGPFSEVAQTPDKTAATVWVTGLRPSTPYFFVVRTITEPNPNDANVVTSVGNPSVSRSTAACGRCDLPGLTPVHPPAPADIRK